LLRTKTKAVEPYETAISSGLTITVSIFSDSEKLSPGTILETTSFTFFASLIAILKLWRISIENSRLGEIALIFLVVPRTSSRVGRQVFLFR
jgi:hypothetical protein